MLIPVQVQGLYRPEDTSDLKIETINGETLISAVVDLPPLGTTESFYADGNGKVKRQILDNAGQQVVASDGIGVLPNVRRNEDNQVSQRGSSRGNITQYTYDERGNVLSVVDTLSASSESLSVGLFPGQVYVQELESVNQLAAAHLNNDDILDLVSTSYDGLVVMQGTGTGYEVIDVHDLSNEGYRDIEFADFNNDGIVDVATIASGGGYGADGSISVLLGNGDGTLRVVSDITVDDEITALAVSDFNDDLLMDIVVGTDYEGAQLFLGTGSGGTFAPGMSFHPDMISSVVSLDLNEDSRQDILSIGGYSVAILESNPDGSFSETELPDEVESSPGLVSVADFNGDGREDVAFASEYGYVSVVFPNGDGTVSPIQTYSEANDIYALVSADVNGDGASDLITHDGDEMISVRLNDGTGEFSSPLQFLLGSQIENGSQSLIVDDWNGDGIVDLALTMDRNQTAVLLGKGDGTFNSPLFSQPLYYNDGLLALDVNQDDALDLISYGRDGLSLLFGTGTGSFLGDANLIALPSYGVGSVPRSVRVADLNADLYPDMVSANYVGDTVSVLLSDGEGGYLPHVDYSVGEQPVGLELADIDGDGALDILVRESRDNQIRLLRGNGDSSFASGSLFSIQDYPSAISVGDVNGDGRTDFAVAHANDVSIFLGNESGQLIRHQNYVLEASRYDPVGDVALVDVDEDGQLDMVSLLRDRQQVSIWHGDGHGSFTEESSYDLGPAPDEIAVGDINNDGVIDLLVSDLDDYSVSVLLSDGAGGFRVSELLQLPERIGEMVIEDVNGDGFSDILIDQGNSFVLFLGDETGSFEGTVPYRFATEGDEDLVVVDVDLDGDKDVVRVDSYPDSRVYIHPNLIDQIGDSSIVSSSGGTYYTYDETFNQVTSVTDELGRQTLYEIDPVTGQRLSMTQVVDELDTSENGETDDVVTRYTYIARGEAAAGQMDTQTDALGRVTDYDYDALGRLERVTYAKGTVDEAVESYEYDLAGNRTAVIDANGNRTEYTYEDGTNRVKTITSAVGTDIEATQSFEYDEMGRQTAVIDAEGNRTEYRYDAMGRQTHVIEADPDGVEGPLASPVSRSVYDKGGNLVESIDPLGRVTRYVYDGRDRLIETILPDESVLSTGYDADNNRTSSIGVDGKGTTSVYDIRGRLIRSIDELGKVTSFEYDVANQMIAQVDANDVRTEYEYDDLGRRIAVTTAAGTAEAITTRTEYDKVGNVVAQIDGLGQRTEYVYDNRNRRQTIIDAADDPGITNFTYDDVGNLLSITDSEQNTTSYVYDERNRLTTETNQLQKTRTFEYDDNGNRTQVRDRNGRVVDYTYDGLNRQISEQWLDGNGQAVNEVVTTYDAADQVTAVSDLYSAYTFTYDALGYQDQVDNTGLVAYPRWF